MSSSACSYDSSSIRSISSSESPYDGLTWIGNVSIPVVSSRAIRAGMPSASTTNVIVTRAMPAVMGGKPRKVKRASERQFSTVSRSPCRTWMSKPVWLSA